MVNLWSKMTDEEDAIIESETRPEGDDWVPVVNWKRATKNRIDFYKTGSTAWRCEANDRLLKIQKLKREDANMPTEEYQDIVVQRDDGLDYHFKGKLIVDAQHEPDAEYGTEYFCGIIQIYEAKVERGTTGKRVSKEYILVTRRHQSGFDSQEVAVTEAGLVRDISMVINLILSKFNAGGVIPKWVKKALDEFKKGKHTDVNGVKEIDG